VAARLELERRVRALADDARDHFLVAAELGRALRDDLDLPALALGVARVHAEQVAGEQRRLVAAGAGAHLEEQVAVVVRVARQQRLLQLGLELLHRARALLQLLVGVAFIEARRHVARSPASRSACGSLVQRDHVGQLGVLARQLLELLHVLAWRSRPPAGVQSSEPPDQAVELRAQRVGFTARRRAVLRRALSPSLVSACVGACISLLVSACDSASSTCAGSSPRRAP
jgi:hypothetical protein